MSVSFEAALFTSATESILGFLVADPTDPLERPSPCDRWTGRQVLNHMVGSAHMFASAARGELPTLPDWDTAPDLLDDDPAMAYALAVGAVSSAFDAASRRGDEVALPFATLPAAFALRLVMADHVTHGWDLARCTGRVLEVDEAVAALSLETFRSWIRPELRAAGHFASATIPTCDPTPLDRVAAFAGRSV
jgi:uncharacterized protein (TIGR03086 family)